MLIVHDPADVPDLGRGTAVTIGAYDGLHLGHRAVIDVVKGVAAERDLATAMVTFDRHPASVVRPESAPLQLCDLDQKLELLESTGLDLVLVIGFDAARASETAEEFVHEVLVDALRATSVIVGADFHFGKGRGGNVGLLEELGPDLGFDVRGIELVDEDGRPADDDERVSSTAIRRALAAGDLARANAMLGRQHEVRGLVAHGDARGRELGFPTANVSVPGSIQLPADGIYAGWFEREPRDGEPGEVHPTAISLGRRPTFYETADASLLEAHLLDFDGDLYDEHVAVRFVERIRGEERFDDVESLVAQMHADCDRAREVLAR